VNEVVIKEYRVEDFESVFEIGPGKGPSCCIKVCKTDVIFKMDTGATVNIL